MNAVSATIADDRRAIVVIYREAGEINYFLLCILLILLKSFNDGLAQPLPQRRSGVGYARPTKPCCGRGKNSSTMVGMFVCLCLASQKPSNWEFFISARIDLGFKLL